MTTPPKPMIRLDAPMVDDARRALEARNRINPDVIAEEMACRRRKALEQLRRNLKSAVKQVEDLLDIEDRRDTAA